MKRISDDFIYLPTPSLGKVLLCAVLSIIWIFISKPSLYPHIHEYYLGGIEGDPGIYVWLAKNVWQNLSGASSGWFQTNAFYPYGQSLAFSDNFIFPGLLYSALYAVLHQEILSYNIMYLLLLVFGSLSTFFLVFGLCEELTISLLGALLIPMLAPLVGHMGHPQLQCFFCFPLILLLLIRYLQSPGFLRGLLVGACIAVAFLCSAYYAVFSALLVAVFLIGFFLIHPKSLKLKDLLPLLLAGICTLSFLLPFILPYIHIKNLFGERWLYEASDFAATPLSYFSVNPFSWLYHGLSSLSHAEAWLGVGITIPLIILYAIFYIFEGSTLYGARVSILGAIFLSLVLSTLFKSNLWVNFIETFLCWGLLIVFIKGLYQLGVTERARDCAIVTNRDILAILLWCAGFFVVLSFGPLFIENYSFSPFTAIYYIFPGMDAVRAIGRAGFVTAILCTIVSLVIISHQHRRKKLSPLFFTVIPLLAIIENTYNRFPYDKPLHVPQAFVELKTLTQEDPKSVAIVLPYAETLDKNGSIARWSEFARSNVYAMNWVDGIPVQILNGFSGQKTKIMNELPRRIQNFPDEGSLRELASFYKMAYIVVVPTLYKEFDAVTFEEKLKRFPNDLSPIKKSQDGSYLIKFIRAQPLDPQFVLKTPGSIDSADISLEVLGSCNEKSIEVQCYETDSLTSFFKFTLSPKNNAELVDIPLPPLKNPNGVRRIRFQTSGGCMVGLRTIGN